MLSGDFIEASVKELDKTGTVILSRPRTLRGGKIIKIKPSKINRLLGKNNTMINQISSGTGTKIVAGLNGMIWLNDGNIDLAVEAIEKVCNEAHIPGLTERIGKLVNKNNTKKNEEARDKVEEEMI